MEKTTTARLAAALGIAMLAFVFACAVAAPAQAYAAGEADTGLRAAGTAANDINALGWKLGPKYPKVLKSTVKGAPDGSNGPWDDAQHCTYFATPWHPLSMMFVNDYDEPDDLVAYDASGNRFEPIKGMDYELVQEHNVEAGIAKVYVQGIGAYKGRILAMRYKIWPGWLNVYDSQRKKANVHPLENRLGRNTAKVTRKQLAKGDVEIAFSYKLHDGDEPATNRKFMSQLKPRYAVDWSRLPKSMRKKVSVNAKTGTVTLKKGAWQTSARIAKKNPKTAKVRKIKGKTYLCVPLKVSMTSNRNVKLVDQRLKVYKKRTVTADRLVAACIS